MWFPYVSEADSCLWYNEAHQKGLVLSDFPDHAPVAELILSWAANKLHHEPTLAWMDSIVCFSNN